MSHTQPQTQQSGGDELDLWMESLGFSRLIDDTTPLNYTYYKQAGFGLIDAFTAGFFYKVCRARERAARIDELRLLAAEVKLSKPRNKFVYNKYLRIAYFNERMAQLQPQTGEGGEV